MKNNFLCDRPSKPKNALLNSTRSPSKLEYCTSKQERSPSEWASIESDRPSHLHAG
ncbi:MAG: hypothetical protein HC772_20095 [Leptolyngbyaceae cyanobacterium CRU_2_3]|nr:hypothetical protein [Leptolyngbyaceae cyanobacterium CRU_2_3]